MKKDSWRARSKRKGKPKLLMDVNRYSNRWIFSFLLILALLFAVLIFRLIYIQVVMSDQLTREALNQLTKSEVIDSSRGIIYDRNKKELAINVSRANVFYDMSAIKQKKKESDSAFAARKQNALEEVAKKVGEILNEAPESVQEKLQGEKIVRLATNIDHQKATDLKELNIIGLSVDDVVRRYYPYNNLASHLIGFTNDENVGQYGIEAAFDEELSGIPGKNVSIKDNLHKKIPLTEEETFQPKEGYSVVLTLDSNIQQFVEEAAEKALVKNQAESVAVIVQNTMTGEILAMTSKSDYNLNNPKAPATPQQEEEWDRLTSKEKSDIWYKNWRNFCVNDQYEPGSTFKLITAAAALEEDTTNPNKTYTCPGVLRDMPGVVISCTSEMRGKKTMAQAVEQSCNISFVKIGRELGKEKFLKFIKAFGFGRRTGIDLNGEAVGMIPASPEDISAVRLATLSYGHGIAVTPIQLVNAVSTIANGGFLNTPRVVKEIDDSKGNVIEKYKTKSRVRVISEQTSETMRNLMERVVLNGTGKQSAVNGYRIGGKSGTAKIASKDGYEDSYNASFVSVAPINDPKITVLVIINKPKGEILGGQVAAPVSGEILAKTLPYLNIPKTEEGEKVKKESIAVPNVYGMLLEDAGKVLIQAGLKFNTESDRVTDGAVVTAQNPSAGTMVEADSIVDLALNNNDADTRIMPDLSKKSKKEIETILNALKVEYNIIGEKGFISQTPKAGSKLDEHTKITVRLETLPKQQTDTVDQQSDVSTQKESSKEQETSSEKNTHSESKNSHSKNSDSQ